MFIMAYAACHLIPLDKCPGVRPIGIGEVVRRIMGSHFEGNKTRSTNSQAAVGPLQLSAGQGACCEAPLEHPTIFWCWPQLNQLLKHQHTTPGLRFHSDYCLVTIAYTAIARGSSCVVPYWATLRILSESLEDPYTDEARACRICNKCI